MNWLSSYWLYLLLVVIVIGVLGLLVMHEDALEILDDSTERKSTSSHDLRT